MKQLTNFISTTAFKVWPIRDDLGRNIPDLSERCDAWRPFVKSESERGLRKDPNIPYKTALKPHHSASVPPKDHKTCVLVPQRHEGTRMPSQDMVSLIFHADNRYAKPELGGVTEEAAASDDWKCPKCSGNCNCSQCRKQMGLEPLGRILPNLAKPSEEKPAERSEPKAEKDVAAKGKRKAKAPREPRTVKAKGEVVDPEFPLPLGVPLTTVAGIELHPQDVGYALQFIEFCVAFEEVFGVNKAQAESLLRDLMLQKYSSVFQFQATLLSVQEVEIQPERRPLNHLNESSWFEYLSCYFSESQLLLKELPSDLFSKGVEGYNSLDFSQKLRVLNFLCDEALDTNDLSNFIKRKGEILTQRKSKAKQKVSAAKAKEISLKEELKTEVAKDKAIAAEDNAASTSDLGTTVSRLKSEVAQAHEEFLEAKALQSNLIQHDSVRTEPYLFDADGHVFWKLKGCDDGNALLLQYVGTSDPFISSDGNWFLYGAEQKEAVEKFCSSVRKRNQMTETLPSSSGSKEALPSSSGFKEEHKLDNATNESQQEDVPKSSAE
ncbi:uncharacterized protein LOC126795722 [Argentina anserina]|uniref:uncharacterized protein LOC126795722 n=1 Tax=Argentina anserina TaxID=57926 RepID=UPI0021763142|nr:uncharacterized protein LOC126795722 [Potentilla anserina]